MIRPMRQTPGLLAKTWNELLSTALVLVHWCPTGADQLVRKTTPGKISNQQSTWIGLSLWLDNHKTCLKTASEMHVAPRISLTVSRREQAFVAIFIFFGSILFMINCRWGRHKRRGWMMAIKVWAVTSVVNLILWSWRQKRWWWKMVLDLSFEKHCKVPTFIFPLAKSVPNLSNLVLGNLSLVGNLQQISRWWAICSSASGQTQSASAVHYASASVYLCTMYT